MLLTVLANELGTDKGNKNHEAHGYTETFQLFMSTRRDQEIKLLEIGVNDPRFPGSSLKMWDKFFTNPDTVIYGLDLYPPTGFDNNPRVKLLRCDQSNSRDLAELHPYLPELDYIIDDGLHTFDCQITSFMMMFPKLKSGGVYFIEDCHAKDCYKTIDMFKNIHYDSFNISGVNFYHNNKLIAIIKK